MHCIFHCMSCTVQCRKSVIFADWSRKYNCNLFYIVQFGNKSNSTTFAVCDVFAVADDWTVAAASLSQIVPSIPDTLQTNTVRVYISATMDRQPEVSAFMKVTQLMLIFMTQHTQRNIKISILPVLPLEVQVIYWSSHFWWPPGTQHFSQCIKVQYVATE